MKLNAIVQEVETRAAVRPIGALQKIRKARKGLARLPGNRIFSSQTILPRNAPTYAFHRGGRRELQFNIAFDSVDSSEKLRHGVGFSLEPGQTLPDIEVLKPSVERFNNFLDKNPEVFRDMWMWHYKAGKPSRKYRPIPIPLSLFKPHVFIFLGRLQPLGHINYERILDDFDRLLVLYQFVEGTRASAVHAKTDREREGRPPFVSGTKEKRNEAVAEIAKQTRYVDLRHNRLQTALLNLLQSRYGRRNAVREWQNKVDVAVRRGTKYWFYEIKISNEARLCIREGIGQLLEYSYGRGAQEAVRLIIVGEPVLDSETRDFLKVIRRRFSLPIEYQQFEIRKDTLIQFEG